MSIDEIKIMLSILVKYKSSRIKHIIPGLIELIYSKEFQCFQVTTIIDGRILTYNDVNIASEALYTILNTIKRE
ncbi:hypothetical protein ABV89_18605 [Priestia aryabhattai]|nr:hypothetical protein VL11_25920 [Priestia aryabhattai]KMN98203.1 hypothetical protein ABV89_18605 [Priestia aryabhattai]